jgi:hypothetical protein
VATLTNANYEAPDATGSLVIAKAPRSFTWAPPAAITYGTPLSVTQLNATVNGDGALTYSPSSARCWTLARAR